MSIVRDLPRLTTFTSSGGAAVTFAIGGLDDAQGITLFFTSSFSGTSSAGIIQVTQHDPASTREATGVQSTTWHTYGTVTSSGAAVTITDINFRGLRVSGFTATSSAAGEILAYVSKQVLV